ncbi:MULTISPECIES: LLM class flavin-dependent oxidoreductase [Amycolatopsis]|uniref:Flavin-dependent oxidoreductase, luciferase family (Includes alkanesulfonate monooxygenase SsuD and methylene tetrahydromethanopterin reductase) n=2 Tax=Amycolatopsis TaxID=1813 RepID=A0A1I3X457_9PSEU|nr:LLM class flavin-dependent oxidoreductase [Amycolatopsis sacchari]SFK14320.1 Flavin-dependent oxidoreductase, luciferase family (includes alkanesulfonate monooxygenase SsuD and methylene tetrahydromethanopterin reductase) [Amycolatopsis sacchari]
MEFGLLLPSGSAQVPSRAIVDTAVTAERLGFDSVWAGDSMVRARLEPLTLLSAVAQATERVRLGTAVLIPAHRHPVQAAITLSSLDVLSGGRLVVGVGAGFPGFSEQEFNLVGVRFKTRFSHLDDTVTLWRQLWTGRPARFDGKVLHYDWLPEVPRPVQPGGPPVWLGGITPAALRRTGQLYDGWLPYPPDPADYAKGLATIREGGRDVTPALFATVYLDDDAERGTRALDEYCRAVYARPLDFVGRIQAMLTGPDLATQLARFAEAGAGHVLLRIAAVDPGTYAGQLEMAAELLSVLRRRLG